MDNYVITIARGFGTGGNDREIHAEGRKRAGAA